MTSPDAPQPGFVERAAATAGKAANAFVREFKGVATTARAAFIGAWAQSEKWRGGEWSRAGAQLRAAQNSWLWIALGLVASEVAGARFRVVQQAQVDGEPSPINNHPLEKVLRRPNPWISRAFLWVYSVYWYFLDGNFYWFLAFDEYGELAEIWPLPANQVIVWPGDGERFIDYYKYMVNGIEYRIPTEYIVHVKRPNLFDIFRGMSVLVQAMLPVDSDLAMAQWNGAFFGQDNVMPSAIINLSSGDPSQPINPADAEALKADLMSEYAAINRKTAVTTANSVSAVLLGWNAKDMDFLPGRKFTKEEIWELVGVPPGMLDVNATEANANVAERIFKNSVWSGPMTMIAEQLTAELVIPYFGEDQEATFDDIRISDRAQDIQELAVVGPYLKINEVRKKYWKLPPVSWGDVPAGPAHGAGDQGTIEVHPSQAPTAADAPPAHPGQHGLHPGQNGTEPPAQSQPAGKAFKDAAAAAELRRWRDKAIKTFKAAGSADVKFETNILAPELAADIRQALATAATLEEVKAVFEPSHSALERAAAALERAVDALEQTE